jgi:hypothetical protein
LVNVKTRVSDEVGQGAFGNGPGDVFGIDRGIDPVVCYPEFLRYLDELVAKSQNALRGRFENFWSTEQTSVVRLIEPDDVLDKMLYALTNPVKDPLVNRVREWQGVNFYGAILSDTALTASRPKHFFRADGDMPESAELQLVRRRVSRTSRMRNSRP